MKIEAYEKVEKVERSAKPSISHEVKMENVEEIIHWEWGHQQRQNIASFERFCYEMSCCGVHPYFFNY